MTELIQSDGSGGEQMSKSKDYTISFTVDQTPEEVLNAISWLACSRGSNLTGKGTSKEVC